MCLICIEYQNEKLSVQEAWKNLDEMKEVLDEEHVEEVVDMLADDLVEECIREVRRKNVK